jgi:hypothetical protein
MSSFQNFFCGYVQFLWDMYISAVALHFFQGDIICKRVLKPYCSKLAIRPTYDEKRIQTNAVVVKISYFIILNPPFMITFSHCSQLYNVCL